MSPVEITAEIRDLKETIKWREIRLRGYYTRQVEINQEPPTELTVFLSYSVAGQIEDEVLALAFDWDRLI